MTKIKNYHTIRYGNKDGEIKFGHIHSDEQIAAFYVRSGYDERHTMQMDATGDVDQGRKGGTIFSCPGSFQVKCGDDVKDGAPAFYIEAVNGDIVLNAKNGRIRMMAENIDMIAEGADTKNGNITLTSNQNVFIKSKNYELLTSSLARIASTGTVKVTADAVLNIFGGLIDAADGATQPKGSKCSPSLTEEENNSLL
jgi:hypothetical protein